MTEAELIALIISMLQSYGADAEALPTREGVRTADLKFSFEGDLFLVELKQREGVAEYSRELSELSSGDFAEMVPQPLDYRNNHSSVIRDGVRQLQQTVESGDEFRLLWLEAGDEDSELHGAQYEATLCGEKYLFCLGRDRLESCYFFTNSEFYTCRDGLDGAFLSSSGACKLLINPYSPRYSRLRQAPFLRCLGSAVWDPVEMERQGRVMIVDADIDRRDESAVLDYICNKYGVMANVMPINRYGVLLAVDSSEVGD